LRGVDRGGVDRGDSSRSRQNNTSGGCGWYLDGLSGAENLAGINVGAVTVDLRVVQIQDGGVDRIV